MMDLEKATELANAHLRVLALELGDELAIDQDATMRGRPGWLFFWNTTRYLQGGSISDALAGNGPLLVHAETGNVEQLPVEARLDDFARVR